MNFLLVRKVSTILKTETGKPAEVTLGPGTFTRSYEYDSFENISSIVSGEWRQSFNFDGASGNLMSRSYMNGDLTFMRTENFQYDTRERLTTSQVTGQGQKIVTYDQTGNILTKTDAGTYTYNSAKVNALASVTFIRGAISTNLQTIAYNSQNKAMAISEDVNSYNIVYGADGERIRSRLYANSVLTKTMYYAPGYEKISTTAGTVENHYISSPFGLEAIIVKAGTSETMYLAETDHLGSLIGLRNTAGVYVERYSYDAWGRRRNPADWTFVNVPAPTITDRGFTGHEHLDKFRLINMNGRLYDPVTGRFLNADPVIDNTGGAQGLNSYTYCLNNPLKFTDPSGYIKAALPEEIVMLNPGLFKYAGYGHYSSSWFTDQFVTSSGGGGGGGMYGKPGQGGNGTGLGGIYYDNVSGNYRDVNNYKAVSQEVFINVIESHRDYQVTWLYYSGSVDNPYARLTGFSLSDGTRVDFIDNAQTGGDKKPMIGLSLDATLALPGIGYTGEVGIYFRDCSQFVSHGKAFGPEASIGFNLICIIPFDNFKSSDIEGLGASIVGNFGPISISLFTNSSPAYPENSILDSYIGIKIGYGIGLGGSYSPDTKTTFTDWIPDYSQSFFHWR